MPSRDVEGRAMGFGPGWDRQDPWTLRFSDPGLERAYVAAVATAARQRLTIACLIGTALWASAAIIGPPLLKVPYATFVVAASVTCTLNITVIVLTRRPLRLAHVWALSVAANMASTAGIIFALSPGETFLAAGAPALMLNGIFAFGLIRLAAWVAAALGVIQVLLFSVVLLALGSGSTGVFLAFLLSGTMTVAAIGSRYLEGAERTAFAQGHLVADLHQRIDRLFRQYLSPDVAQALVDDPDRAELGGELAEVSVLFADLRGYTTFSERTAPNEVVAMLNASFGAAVPAVFAEGGTIVQFVGDALMAIFNAPLRQSDHALRACRAGLALQRSASAIGGDEARPRFRVGINTGPALVGNIGSAELRNFSALGDATNVAARLQTYAQPGTVVIGERTYSLVRDVAEVLPLGAPDLKGKTLPIEVYELIGLDS